MLYGKKGQRWLFGFLGDKSKPIIQDQGSIQEIKTEILRLNNSYYSFVYSELGPKYILDIIILIKELTQEINIGLVNTTKNLNALNNTLNLRKTFERIRKHELTRNIDIEVNKAVNLISENMCNLYNITLKITNYLEKLKDFMKNAMKITSECLEKTTEIDNPNLTLTKEILGIQKEIEAQEETLKTLANLLENILIPYCKNLSSDTNPGNYKDKILEEARDKTIRRRIELLLTNLNENITDERLKNSIIKTMKHIKELLNYLNNIVVNKESARDAA